MSHRSRSSKVRVTNRSRPSRRPRTMRTSTKAAMIPTTVLTARPRARRMVRSGIRSARGSRRCRSIRPRRVGAAAAMSTRIALAEAMRADRQAGRARRRRRRRGVSRGDGGDHGVEAGVGEWDAELVGVALGDHTAEQRAGHDPDDGSGGADDDRVGEVAAQDGAIRVADGLHDADERALHALIRPSITATDTTPANRMVSASTPRSTGAR